MRRAISGFTLLEVLLALLIISVGLLGFAGTLGPVAALAGEGKARGRAALQLMSRMSHLRSEVLAAAPACLAPSAGFSRSASGIDETWSGSVTGSLVEVRVIATIPTSRSRIADTLVTRVPCP